MSFGYTNFSYCPANGEDLNNFKTECHLFVFNCLNTPDGGNYGFLDVSYFNGTGFIPGAVVRQVFTDHISSKSYTRFFYVNESKWTNWTTIWDLTVEQYRLYDFIDGISEWSGQLNLCRKINVIKGNYYIFLESYNGNLDSVIIAKHNMNLQNHINIIVELTNGQGGTNNRTYGYGRLLFNTNGDVILTTNVKRDDIEGFFYVLVP